MTDPADRFEEHGKSDDQHRKQAHQRGDDVDAVVNAVCAVRDRDVVCLPGLCDRVAAIHFLELS